MAERFSKLLDLTGREYVLASDYDLLAAQLAEAQEALRATGYDAFAARLAEAIDLDDMRFKRDSADTGGASVANADSESRTGAA